MSLKQIFLPMVRERQPEPTRVWQADSLLSPEDITAMRAAAVEATRDILDRASEANSCILTEARMAVAQAEQDIASAQERLRRASIAVAMGEAAQAKLDMHPERPVPAPAPEDEALG